MRRRLPRGHLALVAIADCVRGRQQPIQAEKQLTLAAVAEQHLLKPPTGTHGRRWSATRANDRRRYIYSSACPTTIPQVWLGQLQQRQSMPVACPLYDAGCALEASLHYPVLVPGIIFQSVRKYVSRFNVKINIMRSLDLRTE